jgi:heat-inducible transcriptional repressor
MNCSSATVRNEMSFLEENGLIEKTHISSGRIPSEKGYRYYVDNIMKPKEITGEDMLKLQTIFHNNQLMLADYITKSVEIVSEMTSLTAIVLGSSSKENKVSKIEVIPLNENSLVAIIITDKGHVEHKNINLTENVSIVDIKKTVDLINKMIIGTPIDEVGTKLEYEVKPIIEKYIKQHEVLYNAFYNAFTDFTNSSYTMTGRQNILMQPEFDDTEKIRDIINKFEDKEMVNSIKEDENGINIYIGSENEFDKDVTIIKTKYSINGEEGTIALIGPKRMEYDRVISLLDYIMKNIDN